jgi:cytidylate kinase
MPAASTRGPEHPTVTVSATYGAGGSVIAPKLAERLDVPFFDRLIHPGAKQGNGGERVSEAERDQAPPAGILAGLANLTSVLGLPVSGADADPRRQLKRQVEQSVFEVLGTTGGVILGRAAAVVLTGRPSAFNVRLTGPTDRCLARAMAIEAVPEAEARTRQADTDKAWSKFVMRLFDRDPSDPALYHLVIDATVFSIDQVVEMVATAASAFWSRAVPA